MSVLLCNSESDLRMDYVALFRGNPALPLPLTLPLLIGLNISTAVEQHPTTRHKYTIIHRTCSAAQTFTMELSTILAFGPQDKSKKRLPLFNSRIWPASGTPACTGLGVPSTAERPISRCRRFTVAVFPQHIRLARPSPSVSREGEKEHAACKTSKLHGIAARQSFYPYQSLQQQNLCGQSWSGTARSSRPHPR